MDAKSPEYNEIIDTVFRFYQKATQDIIIGYHFRHIENFESHIPRIADFWELQLLGTITHKESLPFDLMSVHKPLQLKRGEIGRWIVLFQETLDEKEFKYISSSLWMEKVNHFRDKLTEKLLP